MLVAKLEKPDLANMDVTAIDSRIFVVMATSLLVLLARNAGFVYVPSRRAAQVKAILLNLPKVLGRFGPLKREIVHELAKAVRSDADVYLKGAARELRKLFAEE